jgi:hypothetical protein
MLFFPFVVSFLDNLFFYRITMEHYPLLKRLQNSIELDSRECFETTLQEAIQAGIDLNCPNDNVLILIQRRDWDIRPLLQVPRLNVNVMDAEGDTPLKRAIAEHRNTNVRLLLEAKVDPNQRYSERYDTPLRDALIHCNDKATRILLKHNADIFARVGNHNILTTAALCIPNWNMTMVTVVMVSEWDIGVCVLEEGDRILKILIEREKRIVQEEENFYPRQMQHVLTNTATYITTMKSITTLRLSKFLERAVGIKDLARSILCYF